MAMIESADDLFNETIKTIGLIVRSFNQKDFPDQTIKLVELLQIILKNNKRVLRISRNPVEEQLRDSLIDLEGILTTFLVKVQPFVARKDFNGARSLFKEPIGKKFLPTLLAKERGKSAPGTVWKENFEELSRMSA